jgi:hypothetical protein
LNGTVTISPTANVFVGDELIASYSGTEAVTWQWNKSGTVINGATNVKYTPTESGSYTVTANATGYHSKTSTAVEVKFAIILLEEIQGSGTRFVFEYDNFDRVTKRSEYSENVLQWVETFKYSADGNSIEWKEENIVKTTFVKNDKKITWEYDEDDMHYEIELNAQGFPVKYTKEWVGENGDWYKLTSSLTWQNENLTKEDTNGGMKEEGLEFSFDSSITFTFDNKKSPFYHCKTPKWFLWYGNFFGYSHNVNNIKTLTRDGTNTTTYEYTYDDDGVPVSRTGGGVTETYKYKKR